ncbi:unnamed protein product [Rhodiola kirilowii]
MSGNVLLYEKGRVMICKEVPIKNCTRDGLLEWFKGNCRLAAIREVYYLQPGNCIDKGLHEIVDEAVVEKMMTYASYENFVQIYVVEPNEAGPREVRGLVNISPSSNLVAANTLGSQLETMRSPSLEKENEIEKGESSRLPANLVSADSEDDVVIGAESSSEEADSYFYVSEDEVNDEFDYFCDENVDVGNGKSVTQDGGTSDVVECVEVDDVDTLDSGCWNGVSKGKKWKEFNTETDFKQKIVFEPGLIFESNSVFRKALIQYSLEHGADYYYLQNNANRVAAYCLNKCNCKKMKYGRKACTCGKILCAWKVSAARMYEDGTFQVKSVGPNHTCGWQRLNTKVTSIWLAEKYLENYRNDPSWSLVGFQGSVLRDYKLEITYKQAWRGRLRAMLMTQGDKSSEYGKVWDYAHTVLKTNPGSSAIVKVDLGNPEKPLFQRLYVCLDALKWGFLRGCRDIVGLDGCHLKGAYTGQVLVAVGKDGNNNIYPIAYAAVESETKDSWMWFIEQLVGDIGGAVPTYISDRQKGLRDAINWHGNGLSKGRICVRHMYENFKKTWPGLRFKELVWKAARAYTAMEFNAAMEEIKKMDVRAYNYLMKEEVVTWARHRFDPSLKCDIILNNLCESFNAWILLARELPILSMMEWIRRQLMNRFFAKRQFMAGYEHQITPNIRKQIDVARMTATKDCKCYFGGGSEYEIHHHGNVYVVDLAKKTC